MAVAIGLLLGSVAFASPTLSPSLAPPTSSTAVVVVEGKEKRPARSRALLTYHIQKALKLNIGLKIMLIMCLSIPIVTFLGFLNYILTGQDFLGSIFKSYAILADVPGADALDGQADDLSGKNVWSVLCFNAAYFIGVFTFAVFLGLLVNDIENKIEEVKYSNSYVLYETQHALLLHWNRLTIPILQKMARAHRFYEGGTKKTVVVSLTARTHARAPADHPRRSPAQPILTPAALFRW